MIFMSQLCDITNTRASEHLIIQQEKQIQEFQGGDLTNGSKGQVQFMSHHRWISFHALKKQKSKGSTIEAHLWSYRNYFQFVASTADD